MWKVGLKDTKGPISDISKELTTGTIYRTILHVKIAESDVTDSLWRRTLAGGPGKNCHTARNG